jgi:hypothetical protein
VRAVAVDVGGSTNSLGLGLACSVSFDRTLLLARGHNNRRRDDPGGRRDEDQQALVLDQVGSPMVVRLTDAARSPGGWGFCRVCKCAWKTSTIDGRLYASAIHSTLHPDMESKA